MLCACVDACDGNQWISKLRKMPIAIGDHRRDDRRVSERRLDIGRGLPGALRMLSAAVLSIGSRILMPRPPDRPVAA